MSKKILSIFLTVLLLAIIPLSASAEASVQPRYTFVASEFVDLSISGGVAYADCDVTGYSNVTSIKVTMTLQKKTLWWWEDVTEWSSITPSKSIVMSESTSVGSGTYRVKMVALVCAGTSASEEIEDYSDEVKN